jgi:hypothetical protein
MASRAAHILSIAVKETWIGGIRLTFGSGEEQLANRSITRLEGLHFDLHLRSAVVISDGGPIT